jgi:NTP pyrophosphatase (non-canonical NTP hydrolase)
MDIKLLEKLIKFRNDRGWGKDHIPKYLAMAISIEASELLENWLWSDDIKPDNNCEEEIGDIGIYLYYLCHELHIDLETAMYKKIPINESKYPLENYKNEPI